MAKGLSVGDLQVKIIIFVYDNKISVTFSIFAIPWIPM